MRRPSRASAGGARASGRSTESVANGTRFTLESIIALLTSGQSTTLLLKVSHADGRKCRGSMVLGLVVDGLVDRDGGVNDRRLNSLLLDDGLDGLAALSVRMYPACLG